MHNGGTHSSTNCLRRWSSQAFFNRVRIDNAHGAVRQLAIEFELLAPGGAFSRQLSIEFELSSAICGLQALSIV